MSSRPFVHEDHCRFLPSAGVGERCAAGCRAPFVRVWRGVAFVVGVRIDPATQSPEPSKSAALHHPGCAASPETVTVERNGRDGGWRSQCRSCDSTTLFWREDVWDIPERGDPALVTRAGEHPLLVPDSRRGSGGAAFAVATNGAAAAITRGVGPTGVGLASAAARTYPSMPHKCSVGIVKGAAPTGTMKVPTRTASVSGSSFLTSIDSSGPISKNVSPTP